MNGWLLVCVLVLLLTVLVGLWRVAVGPRPADRMLAAQLMGTTGVALLLVLAQVMQVPAFQDVALVLALLAMVASLAFVRQRGLTDPGGQEAADDR
ncbi:MAG: monovalent cation/H+ antiporter complex subunit F [Halothiobacillaceae bacterium]